MTTGEQLAAEVRRLGLAAGLDAVAICDARPFDDTRQLLFDRAALGWSAGMQFTYRNPERSTSPDSTLPGAAAIVVGARRLRRGIGHGRHGRERLGAVATATAADSIARSAHRWSLLAAGAGGDVRLGRPLPTATRRPRSAWRSTCPRPAGGRGWSPTTTPWSIGPRRCGPAWAGTARTPTCSCPAPDPGSCSAPSSPTHR